MSNKKRDFQEAQSTVIKLQNHIGFPSKWLTVVDLYIFNLSCKRFQMFKLKTLHNLYLVCGTQ